MQVTKGNIVRIDVELARVDGGGVIESSKKTGPVEYRHGSGQMLKGLEDCLEGMSVGDEKSGTIEASRAFGTEDSQPTMTIGKAEFPKDAKLEEGAEFEAKSPQGTAVTLKITKIEGDQIHTRVVHPLAGKDIEYKVKVLSVRPPPPPVPQATVLEEADLEEDA